jgi:DNA helicase IV
MRDIVATIQAEQDEMLVIEGGPGTGGFSFSEVMRSYGSD